MSKHEISIAPESMKMIVDEAVEAFWTSEDDPSTKESIDRGVSAAVRHAFDHALEEGIVVPGWQLDPGVEGSIAFHAANLEEDAKVGRAFIDEADKRFGVEKNPREAALKRGAAIMAGTPEGEEMLQQLQQLREEKK